MKKITFILITFLLIGSCDKKEEINFDYVESQFQEHSNKIEKIEYRIERIDTFSRGDVWNNKGYALLEKDEKDKNFNFSFYGKRDDVEKTYLYDKGTGFEINTNNKNYKLLYVGGMLGSPGGQMVVEDILTLDSVYKNPQFKEEEKKYILKYDLESDTVYDITARSKTVELSKEDFFPIKITYRRKKLGKNEVTQYIFSDIKINDAVENSIADFKDLISDYEVIPPIETLPNKILNNKFPDIKLPNLLNEEEIVNIETGKLILIDFWEVWCSPCIKSFPKVEEFSTKYKDELQVVGIVSQSKESAIQLVENKKISFKNLLGSNTILEEYEVNSYPRYFLINQSGIVIKEYHGFSDDIENDVKREISGIKTAGNSI